MARVVRPVLSGCCVLVVERGAEAGVAEDVAALPVGQDDPEVGHELHEAVGAGFEVGVDQVPVGAGPGGFPGGEGGLRPWRRGRRRRRRAGASAPSGASAVAWRLRSSCIALRAWSTTAPWLRAAGRAVH